MFQYRKRTLSDTTKTKMSPLFNQGHEEELNCLGISKRAINLLLKELYCLEAKLEPFRQFDKHLFKCPNIDYCQYAEMVQFSLRGIESLSIFHVFLD